MTAKKSKSPNHSTERARKAAMAEIQERMERQDQEAASGAEVEPAATDSATPEAGPPETPAPGLAVAGPDAGSPNGKAKKGGKGAKAAKEPKAATPKPAKAPKAPKPAKEKKPKKVSLLDCAATVLASAKEPMMAKEVVAEVLSRKMWSTKGETPEATLYAAMIREIAAKKGEARFKKVDRGMFVATPTAHAGKGA